MKFRRPACLVLALISVAAIACNDSDPAEPVNEIFIDPEDGVGCAQMSFPADQPDLSAFNPPRFLLEGPISQQPSNGQVEVRPGETVTAIVVPNAATRFMRVELTDAWTPGVVAFEEEFETAGGDPVELTLAPDANSRGRFYLKLTLCGDDCRDRQVVFDIVACPLDQNPPPTCGVNVPYERTLIEDGEIVEVNGTCVDFGLNPGFGSGTVVIQNRG